MSVLADVAAGTCALIFLAAALGKLDSWSEWSRLTEEIPGPARFGDIVRVVVPALEGVIVVLSFVVPIIGLATGAVVLTVFAGAVWLFADRLGGRECHCFGAIAPGRISRRLAARNVALGLAGAGGWYAAWHAHAHALSLGKLVLTLLVGAIMLMLFQFRSLFGAVQAVQDAKEVE